MPDKTKIVLSNGAELRVTEEAQAVAQSLSLVDALAKFTTSRGDIYVGVGQVAYVEPIHRSEGRVSAPTFGSVPQRSRHAID